MPSGHSSSRRQQGELHTKERDLSPSCRPSHFATALCCSSARPCSSLSRHLSFRRMHEPDSVDRTLHVPARKKPESSVFLDGRPRVCYIPPCPVGPLQPSHSSFSAPVAAASHLPPQPPSLLLHVSTLPLHVRPPARHLHRLYASRLRYSSMPPSVACSCLCSRLAYRTPTRSCRFKSRQQIGFPSMQVNATR